MRAAPSEDQFRFRPSGRVSVEFGIDSLERKSYRPTWSFSFPAAFDGRSRAFADLSYWQRINGQLEGVVDFWLLGGLEHRVSDTLSIEASLNHFCRHLTSTYNPSVLNLNEAAARVRVRTEEVTAGLGIGTYVGGSRGYNHLALFDLAVPRLLLDELSLSAAFKWVNFSDILYEVAVAVDLVSGAELFFKSVKTYEADPTSVLGLRFLSEGAPLEHVDSFDLSAGVYPYFDRHKLLVLGGYRLAFFREPSRRLIFDAEFRSPILSGGTFLGEFWPDRMIYDLSAEYEKKLGGLFASAYARYGVDMPADKAVPFRASLAAGLAVRNQPDFDRLEKPVRFELRGGRDFKFDYDLGAKIGLNTIGGKVADAGAEFRVRANAERTEAEAQAFVEFGGDVAVRPFIGLRKISYYAGGPPPDGPFRRILTAGLSLFRWF